MKNLALFVVVVLSTIARGEQLPYCSGASFTGAQFWTWTVGSIDQACQIVRSRLAGVGAREDSELTGFYYGDQYNSASVSCNQGSLQASGYGAQVFQNAISLFQSRGFSGCTIQVFGGGSGGGGVCNATLECSACDIYGNQTCRTIDCQGNIKATFTQACVVNRNEYSCGSCQSYVAADGVCVDQNASPYPICYPPVIAYKYDVYFNGSFASTANGFYSIDACVTARNQDSRCR